MDTKKLKNTVINFMVPIIALVLTLLLFLVVIYPAITSLPLLKDELTAKRNLENQLKTKLTTLNKLLDFESVVMENAEVVAKVLVSEPTVPELLTQIDMIAKESGLAINKLSYSFGEATEEESMLPYSVVNVSLGAIGNYDQMNTFLINLESGSRLVDVSTFRFAAERTEETTGLFNVTFILRSPYLSVESSAVTDEPVNVDVADPEFIEVLDRIKQLRFYDISVDTQYIELEESTPEEIEESIEEEEIPEGEVSEEELEELVGEQTGVGETTP